MLAANILNKQSWNTGPRSRTDNLERPWQRKIEMRFGRWNVRSLYMRWAEYVARLEEGRSAFKILTGKPTGKIPLGRPRLGGQCYNEP